MKQLQPLLKLLIVAVCSLSPLWLAANEDAKLEAIFRDAWDAYLRNNPLTASSFGDRRFNREWGDYSIQSIEAYQGFRRGVLEKLAVLDFNALSKANQLNFRLFKQRLENDLEAEELGGYLVVMNQRGGIQTIHTMADSFRFQTVADFEDWLARLEALPTYVDQTIDLLKLGIEKKVLQPKVIMQRLKPQIARQVVEKPEDSPFFERFSRYPDGIEEKEQTRLTEQAKKVIAEKVVPAYTKFQTFFNETYYPACLDKVGIWQQPTGKKRYAALARHYTTTDLTPEQIHEIGQQEVKRIRGEMVKIIEQVEFKGDFQAFLHFLRTDPQFYYDNPEDLLEAYRAKCKEIDFSLVKLFRKFPRMPYGVEPIPDATAPDTTTAYYRRPAVDGSRPGTYFVNLYRPEVRPKYEIEALSIHEAVPGHHFQISLAQELGELPAFRRYQGYTAFTEGWGLYSESLGEELGFYQDPYSKFGQLTYEMWRAVRLVVDTGMHYLGWSRDQAITFFKENAAKAEHDIINEIDRYVAWPGQALAYKIGELKIKEMRALSEKELGDRFDIREFHEMLLSQGAIPLDVLESSMKQWIDEVKAR